MTSRSAVIAALVLSPCPGVCADPAPPRYALRPGDHLVYRQQLERSVTTPRTESVVRFEWTSHGLILEAGANGFVMGFQRNRTAATLVRYREGGRDRLDQERPLFDERLAKQPRVFAEANAFRDSGVAVLPWSALRETRSEALPYFHEIEPLPLRALQPGESFPRPGDLPSTTRAMGEDLLGERNCLRFEASAAQDALRVRSWFCPSTGALDRLEVEGRYDAPPNRTVREALSFSLTEKRQGEETAGWLADPDLRQGALAALQISGKVPVEAVHALLGQADEATERRALSLLYRRRLPLPAHERLVPYLDASSPVTRRLAQRLTDGGRAGHPALAALARAVRGSGPLPAWNCDQAGAWSEAALGTQLLPVEMPGTTLRHLKAGPFAGLPYIIHVPDDYRGDQPLPLVVDLSGGPGLAISGALADQDALTDAGYLVVYPQAVGAWWDEKSAQAFDALWRELLAGLNIDSNRVLLTGFSNGGTGALLWATRWPHRFAAVAPLMGGGLPFFATDPPLVQNLGRLPLLFLHGDDDEIIPPLASRKTVEAIKERSPDTPVLLHLLRNREHDVVLGRDGAQVLEFFGRQVRDPFPRRVVLKTRDLAYARNHWVEILDKEGGLAEIETRIDEAGVVEVKSKRVKRLRLLLRRELLRPGPFRVVLNGRTTDHTFGEDCQLLVRSWREMSDPFLAYSGEIVLEPRSR